MEILGDFELYREQAVGKGGGGEVYKGRQVSLNRPVAIKFLNKEYTDDKLFVQRFHREAECLCKLTDEHIIQIYGAGEYQGDYYYAMEYVPGLPLTKFIQHHYRFSPDDVIYVGIAVAKALKAAWDSDERIIHRDIKPSNIMMAFPQSVLDSGRLDMKEARIKVMDFGLARAVNAAPQDTELTVSGTIVGTPKYLSPEQALSKPVDIRTDIYSLGIVLYEIAVGRHPFTGDSFIELINEHIHKTPPAPRAVNPQIPAELEAVIVKCIQKNPDARYNTPTELVDDLEAVKLKRSPLYANLPGRQTGPMASVSSRVVPPVKRTASGRLLRWLVFLLLLAGLGLAIKYFVLPHPKVQTYINPNIEPAQTCEPSHQEILSDEQVEVVNRLSKDINNPFDYGTKIVVFIRNRSQETQNRTLRIELTWQEKTYYKERQITLYPNASNSFSMDFYEPTAGEEYYQYRILVKK
ncbi:MAG: serine/threonine-protein kinase [Planctomycetota bacterium]